MKEAPKMPGITDRHAEDTPFTSSMEFAFTVDYDESKIILKDDVHNHEIEIDFDYIPPPPGPGTSYWLEIDNDFESQYNVILASDHTDFNGKTIEPGRSYSNLTSIFLYPMTWDLTISLPPNLPETALLDLTSQTRGITFTRVDRYSIIAHIDESQVYQGENLLITAFTKNDVNYTINVNTLPDNADMIQIASPDIPNFNFNMPAGDTESYFEEGAHEITIDVSHYNQTGYKLLATCDNPDVVINVNSDWFIQIVIPDTNSADVNITLRYYKIGEYNVDVGFHVPTGNAVEMTCDEITQLDGTYTDNDSVSGRGSNNEDVTIHIVENPPDPAHPLTVTAPGYDDTNKVKITQIAPTEYEINISQYMNEEESVGIVVLEAGAIGTYKIELAFDDNVWCNTESDLPEFENVSWSPEDNGETDADNSIDHYIRFVNLTDDPINVINVNQVEGVTVENYDDVYWQVNFQSFIHKNTDVELLITHNEDAGKKVKKTKKNGGKSGENN